MLARVGRNPSWLLPFPCLHLQGMWSTENTQTHQQEKTGVRFSCACWISSSPSACCKSLSNISVITRRAVQSRIQCSCHQSWRYHALHMIVWMSGCHRHYRYKRNITHTQSQILQISQLNWLRTLGRVQNVTFSLCVCTFVTTGIKKIRKVEPAGGW